MYSIDIFCDVIDNFGDAGVCLHLARSLSQSGHDINLYCNNLGVLKQIKDIQDDENPHLTIQDWSHPVTTYICPQVVINAFNCRLDKSVMEAIRQQHALVINLEYLSAEKWIEGCHGLTSPADGLNSYYFFPGFTDKTGGLNIDQDFVHQCQKHIDLLDKKTEVHLKNINLFCYQNPACFPIFSELSQQLEEHVLTVFTGLALDNFNQLFNMHLVSGDKGSLGSLLIKASPMLQHQEYDQILLHHDLNCVRGEDSIVRAMHTGTPFLWQIYKQEENAHIVKLNSFLDCMEDILLHQVNEQAKTTNAWNYTYIEEKNFALDFAFLRQSMLAYNDAAAWPDGFNLSLFVQRTQVFFLNFAKYLCHQESLSYRLEDFITQKLRA